MLKLYEKCNDKKV